MTPTATQNVTLRRTARRIKKNALSVDIDYLIDPHHTRANRVTKKTTLTGTKAATKKERTKLHVKQHITLGSTTAT
jgi:hypothetical protein